MERDEAAECAVAGVPWAELKAAQHPACKAESGAFMNEREWTRPSKVMLLGDVPDHSLVGR